MLSILSALFAGFNLLTISSAQSDLALPSPLPSPSSGFYSCPSPNAHYCVPGALDLIIHCNSSSIGETSNCNDVLTNLETVDQENAFCYDLLNGDGQAACAISGTAYASSTTFALPATATDPFSTVPTPTQATTSAFLFPTMIPNTGDFVCPKANAAYCNGGGSDDGNNLIIYCNATAMGFLANCNHILAAIDPSDVDAFCYDPMEFDGMAACAINNTVYASSTTYLISSTSSVSSISPTATTTSFLFPTMIPNTGDFVCPKANASYCNQGASNDGNNLIIYCNASAMGVLSNCNHLLAAIDPSDVDAYCYDPTEGDGMAACAINNTVYASSTTYLISSSASVSPSMSSLSSSNVPPSSTSPPVSSIPPVPTVLTGGASHLTLIGAAALVGAVALAL